MESNKLAVAGPGNRNNPNAGPGLRSRVPDRPEGQARQPHHSLAVGQPAGEPRVFRIESGHRRQEANRELPHAGVQPERLPQQRVQQPPPDQHEPEAEAPLQVHHQPIHHHQLQFGTHCATTAADPPFSEPQQVVRQLQSPLQLQRQHQLELPSREAQCQREPRCGEAPGDSRALALGQRDQAQRQPDEARLGAGRRHRHRRRRQGHEGRLPGAHSSVRGAIMRTLRPGALPPLFVRSPVLSDSFPFCFPHLVVPRVNLNLVNKPMRNQTLHRRARDG